MATYVKFHQFTEDLGLKIHDLRSAGDTLKVYLTNITPDVATHAVKADLAEITEENGYYAADIQNDWVNTAGVLTLTGVDVVFTAISGSFGPFRYIVLYNSTLTSPMAPLVGYWDHGSEKTITEGNNFTTDFGANIFSLT